MIGDVDDVSDLLATRRAKRLVLRRWRRATESLVRAAEFLFGRSESSEMIAAPLLHGYPADSIPSRELILLKAIKTGLCDDAEAVAFHTQV
jgi:hypothetical protein